MRSFWTNTAAVAAALLLLVPCATSAQAASLALGCAGTVITTTIPKVGFADDSEKEDIKDYSVVIDFERKAVSWFWAGEKVNKESVGLYRWLPITMVDANSIKFRASR